MDKIDIDNALQLSCEKIRVIESWVRTLSCTGEGGFPKKYGMRSRSTKFWFFVS